MDGRLWFRRYDCGLPHTLLDAMADILRERPEHNALIFKEER